MEAPYSMLIFRFCLLLSFCNICLGVDNINVSQSLTNGMTIESKNGTFQLGFFNPESTSNYYLGIWYKNISIRTVVWVANRQRPVNRLSAVLKINSSTGNLLLLNKNKAVWSASPSRIVQNPVLQLLDSGNLVLREEEDENPDNYLWQSFDYPTDTLLPEMKLGKDFRTGTDRRLSAWKNQSDPSPGTLTWSMNLYNDPQPVVCLGSKKHYRSGPWDGIGPTGLPSPTSPSLFRFSMVSNENETYYMYHFMSSDAFPVARRVLNQTTLKSEASVWVEAIQSWKLYVGTPRDSCDYYGHCGPNGKCTVSNWPRDCDCLKGFKPKFPGDWEAMDYSGGCILGQPLNCQNDEFLQYNHMKVPDTLNSMLDRNMNLMECREKCLRNCSCMAYANSDIRGAGSGCVTWYGDLLDMRILPDGGQDIYIRSLLPNLGKHHSRRRKIALMAGSSVFVAVILLMLLLHRSSQKWIHGKKEKRLPFKPHNVKDGNVDLPLFDMSVIAAATGNFSINNKLGQGGFGTVYKGTLEDGQEIAVKKLSTNSGQGIREFKNEANLVTKLQHRNLVKLLGCSIQDEDKLLIYEYMPNKSLDSFIFEEGRRKMLHWSQRFHIIYGIARGLLYLHQESRLMIIHRDLKPSNILLDSDMNPKISDFGVARTFLGEQNAAQTNRVVGTHGYMAPEYAVYGHFSAKSDVFSFGVLVLEILTGKKNRGLYSPSINLNLIAQAWNLWKEQKALELIDACMVDNCNQSEVLRCVHVSLLCLQQDPDARPSISSVVQMLGSKITSLPQPKEPGFVLAEDSSVNELCTMIVKTR